MESAKIKTVGVVIFSTARNSRKIMNEFFRWQEIKKTRVVFLKDTHTYVPPQGLPSALIRNSFLKKVDMVISFGGDGSLLSVVNLVGKNQIPILGIKTGSLGFLNALPEEGFTHALTKIIGGHYKISQREMLEAVVYRKGKPVKRLLALNDMAIKAARASKLMRSSVSLQGHFLADFKSDGLLVATPTGSTAYSMAAGGPILFPNTKTFLLVPISPHSLNQRPIGYPSSQKLEIRLHAKSVSSRLSADGREEISLSATDLVVLSRASIHTSLVVPENYSFQDTLRRKLHWSI